MYVEKKNYKIFIFMYLYLSFNCLSLVYIIFSENNGV